MTTASPPPGWYPDPQGAPYQRWWDGTQWTTATTGAAAPRWRPMRGLARATAALLIVTAFAQAGLAFAFQSRRTVLGRLFALEAGIDEAAGNDALVAAVLGLAAVVSLAAGIVWLVWFNAAYRNAGTLRSVRYDAWRVWGWVVPFVNLFRPKQMVNDAWMAGDETRDENLVPGGVSLLVQAWWAAWLLGGGISLAAQTTTRLAAAENRLDALYDAARVFTVGAAISAVAALLGAAVVLRTTDRLERRHSARVAPPSTGTTQPVT